MTTTATVAAMPTIKIFTGDISALKTQEALDSWEYKRIVVEVNEKGRSFIQTDKATCVIKKEGFFHRGDLWCTKEMPADLSITGDRSYDLVTRDPFPNGVNFRQLIMYPNEANKEEQIAANKDLHKRVRQKYMPTEADYQRHPSMHRTDTVDYISVVKGEMYLMTDTDEVLMKPGDSCIIRGVNHAWNNRSTEPCVTVGGMADAVPYELYEMEPIHVALEEAGEEVKAWPNKRIVVGSNAQGKSCIMTTQVSSVIKQEGVCQRASLWCTKEMPVDNTIEGDRALDLQTWEPCPCGTVFSSLIVYPENVKGKTPMSVMHRTDTLDYIFVAKGEIYMITDEDEILMKAGDAVVIKGGNNAWSNRSQEPCMLISVMIDAKQ